MSERISHSLIQALRGVPVLASLDEVTLLQLVGASANLYWPADREVFASGQPAEGLYVIVSGAVEILDAEGQRLARLERGDHFGEESLLSDGHHERGARALEDTELMVIPRSSFTRLVDGNPELGEHVRATLASRREARE